MTTERCERGRDENCHPWEYLEDCFSTILASTGPSSVYDDAMRQVAAAMVAAAASVLGWDRAEDACQEWWLRKFHGLCLRYDGSRPFHRYAYDSLQWWCCEYLRSNMKHDLPGLSYEPADHRQNPLQDERQRELPRDDRPGLVEVAEGRTAGDLPALLAQGRFSEAARRQGCSPNALCVRASKGRAKLRKLLSCLRDFFRKERKVFRHGPK